MTRTTFRGIYYIGLNVAGKFDFLIFSIFRTTRHFSLGISKLNYHFLLAYGPRMTLATFVSISVGFMLRTLRTLLSDNRGYY